MTRWVWAALLIGCASEKGATFHEDVAPILDEHCMRCHQSGGIAPMTFETFEETKQWGPAIVAATAARTMPPKAQVVTDGSCGEFDNPGWLSDEQLATLSEWVDADYPEGKETERATVELPVLEGVTHNLMTPEFAPEAVGSDLAEFDEYRCFAIDIGHSGEKFLTGWEIIPGDDTLVHHVIGSFVVPEDPSDAGSQTNAERMAELDAQSPDRLGWPCFSGAGPGVDYTSDPVAWAPGEGVFNLPDGLGVAVPDGAVLVAQVHYNLVDPASAGKSDQTQINLRLADSVETEMFPLYIDYLLGTNATLAPGQPSERYSEGYRMEWIVGDVALDVWSILPHMHQRGKRLVARIERNDAPNECMVQVENWDFNWQYAYTYAEPVRVNPEDTWKITCTFDTEDATEPVLPGWGTYNEMCLTTLYVAIAE